jgi:FTR1 family protein
MFNLSVFLISLRDFTESFLIISLFLGFSKKQNLDKHKLILLGGLIGLFASFTIAICVFFALPFVHVNLSVQLIDMIGHLALIASGILLILLTLKIHPIMMDNKSMYMNTILGNKDLEKISFFFLTFLLVFQEGLEITIFSSTISFLNSFLSNVLSLALGFFAALLIGLIFYRTYLKNHLKKLLKITEFLLIGYGVYLILHGILELIS